MNYAGQLRDRQDEKPQSIFACMQQSVRAFSLRHWRQVGMMLELISWTRPYRSVLLYLTIGSVMIFLLYSSTDKATFQAARYVQFESKVSVREEVSEPIDMPELRGLCRKTKWQPGLYFVCDDSNGGIGNIMSAVLACVRYSIEAGAALTMPKILVRGDDLAALKTGVRQPLSYMFQEAWLIDNLQHNCPQLRILHDIGLVDNFADAQVTQKMQPSMLRKTQVSQAMNLHAKTFRVDLMNWLSTQVDPQKPLTERNPVVVRLELAAFEWSAHIDGTSAWIEFGRLLKWRDDVHHLARDVLTTLHTMYPNTRTGFLGAHLRTESDVKNRELWIDYETQKDLFIRSALERNFSTIYIASGDLDSIKKFTRSAKEQGVAVVTKFDLLAAADAEQLSSMSWDQQAMVDFLLLRRSVFFIGFAPSSFAFALAFARHLDIQPARFDLQEDSKSKIVGDTNAAIYNHGMWPTLEQI